MTDCPEADTILQFHGGAAKTTIRPAAPSLVLHGKRAKLSGARFEKRDACRVSK
jgi:hypothetical protein